MKPATRVLLAILAVQLIGGPAGPDPAREGSALADRPAPAPSPSPRIFVGGETFPVIEADSLHPAAGWPVWLKDFSNGARTEKTSGIAYAGRDGAGRRCFFLADEVGFFHFCRVRGERDTIRVDLEDVRIDASLLENLRDHLRWDFEELALEPMLVASPSSGLPSSRERPAPVDGSIADTLDALLSIEGDARTPENRVLAVRLVWEEDASLAGLSAGEGSPADPLSPGSRAGCWRALGRGDALPGARFWHKYTDVDRGLKGLASSGRFVFLGLDNLGRRGDVRIRGSILCVDDRLRNQVAEVNTATFGIYSIGGLAAPADSVIVVVDRMRMCLDVLQWDDAGTGRVTRCHRFPLVLPGPGGFHYGIPNIEGVSLDDNGDIWCVSDPLVDHYRAMEPALPETVHVYLEAGIPMLYRFEGAPVWEAAGIVWPRGAAAGGPDSGRE